MTVESKPSEILRFGPFEVDPGAEDLRKQGVRIKLQEQPFQVLRILLARPGAIVSREEIKSQIWAADTFVDFDNSLNTAINKVREALGDSADNPRFIETVPKRGYRFVAPVVRTERQTNIAATLQLGRLNWKSVFVPLILFLATLSLLKAFRLPDRVSSGVRGPRIQSLAVLPLTNLSGGTDQEYFSDGMTDALITDLAQFGSVRVISRTSSMRFKKSDKPLPEIARELNVDGIVEGTVQRSGDRVRITAQLIHGPSDKHLWANTYERDMREVLALQDELARAIVGEIKLKITPRDEVTHSTRSAVDPRAYELYLRGLEYSRQRGGPKRTSLDYFKRVIQIDPQWAPPYAQLARSYHWLAGFGNPELYAEAKALALEKEEQYLYLHRVDLAYAYAAAGRKNEARALLGKLERQEAIGMDMGIGLYPIYFALGEKDRGLAWMESALNKKSESLLTLRCWPEFDRMLGDPRFADIVRRVGIPQ